MAYLYRHIRLDKNTPFYIGIGSDDDGKFLRANTSANRNKFWHNIVKKHGYVVHIMLDGITREESIEKEIEFIALYGRLDRKTGVLCNLTIGGEGVVGNVMSDEARAKISLASKNRIVSDVTRAKLRAVVVSEETKKKLSKSLTGRPVSQETKDKIRASNLGQRRSEETKAKLRITSNANHANPNRKKISEQGRENIKAAGRRMKGAVHTLEARAKMSACQIGRKRSPESVAKSAKGHLGNKHTDEYKKRMSDLNKEARTKQKNWKGYITAYTYPEMIVVGKFVSFNDIKDSINVCADGILKVLKGKKPQAKGYFFTREVA